MTPLDMPAPVGVRGLLSRLDPVRLSKAPPTWSWRGLPLARPQQSYRWQRQPRRPSAAVALVVFEPGAAFALAAELTWRALTQ